MPAPTLDTLLRSMPPEVRQAAKNAALDATPAQVTQFTGVAAGTDWKAWLGWFLRVGVIAASAYGFRWAQELQAWHAEIIPLIVAGVALAGGFLASAWNKAWEGWTKYQIAKATAAATAAATVNAGRPVEVPVQPTPQPMTQIVPPAAVILYAIAALGLAACDPLFKMKGAVDPAITKACAEFRRAEASPVVQLAATGGAMVRPAVGPAVASLKAFGDRFCAEGPPAGDTTTTAERVAWLAGVTAEMLRTAR